MVGYGSGGDVAMGEGGCGRRERKGGREEKAKVVNSRRRNSERGRG